MESNATPGRPAALEPAGAPALEDDPVFEQLRREVAQIGHGQDHARLERLLGELDAPIVFVDLETTGGNSQLDRITEIGLVEISRKGVDTWTSLVDPERDIPPFIQDLTGISNEMVRGQPVFAALADGLAARLEGRLFVAHNARFDYGFLQRAFERAGIRFEADWLCTVQLSRTLFPTAVRHGLSALIERFGLEPLGRHRALADADLIWQFWQVIHAHHPAERIQTAIETLRRRTAAKDSGPMSSLSTHSNEMAGGVVVQVQTAAAATPALPPSPVPTPMPVPPAPLTTESGATSAAAAEAEAATVEVEVEAEAEAEAEAAFQLTGDEVKAESEAKPPSTRARTRRRSGSAPAAQLAFDWDPQTHIGPHENTVSQETPPEPAPQAAASPDRSTGET